MDHHPEVPEHWIPTETPWIDISWVCWFYCAVRLCNVYEVIGYGIERIFDYQENYEYEKDTYHNSPRKIIGSILHLGYGFVIRVFRIFMVLSVFFVF